MKLLYFVYIWLGVLEFCQANRKETNIDDQFRLPKTVIPERYILKIQSFMEENNFKHISSVKIQIYCNKPTYKITLHSRNLEIKNVKLIHDILNEMADKTQKLVIKNYELEPEYDFLHIYLYDNLVRKGRYILEIEFAGEIEHAMAGYYRSFYMDESGEKRWITTTQFEPTKARTAFPCFDEPALRSRFSIQLGHQPHLNAISNMPLKYTEQDEKGWVWDTFEDTLKMSTYLIAYSINDLGFKTTIKSNRYGDTTINIWARKKSLQQVDFAIEVTPEVLSFFEEYFNLAYPLSKTDLLAVPDFSGGAMENWGLITFREISLLFVPGVSTEKDKNDILYIIAHELAHYWFGNLVTIKWWAYLWLKEGFATYLARIAVEHLFPDWEVYFTAVLINDMQSAYKVDALITSRPVSIPITDPNTIEEIYDSISYSKGGCVIRMIELFLGNDVLKNGLTYYLNKYKYDSTEPDDLWNSLTIAAHEAKSLLKQLAVKEIMDTWILQSGYPLVTVDRDYTRGTVTVSQKRFLENVRAQDDSCYWIPLTYTTEEENDFRSTKPKRWLPCPKQNITFEVDNSKSWILFNIQASGFYRVNYDKTNWKIIIKQLEINYKKIKTINRVLLLDDVMELAMTGYIDFKIAFDLVKYIQQDDQYVTWDIAVERLMNIAKLLDNTSHYELIQTFISNIVIPVFKKIGGINESLKDFSKFKLLVIKTACKIGNQICEQEAVDIFRQWKQSSGTYTIPEEIRGVIYCQGVKNGGEEEWNYLWQHYLKSDAGGEKETILYALGCSLDRKLLIRYLGWTIKKDSGIRHQDALVVFKSVIKNKKGYSIARSFFYENMKEIYNIQSPKGGQMKCTIRAVANSLRSEKEFNEFKTFLKENMKYFKKALITVKQMLEKLVIWKYWYDYMYPKVVNALEQQVKIMKRKQ